VTRFDAIWLDAGGVLVLPDPTVLGPLLAYFGGSPDIDRHRRAHYAAMAVKSAQGAGELDWREYDEAYVASVGVPSADVAVAAETLGRTRTALLWRWPIPESVEALATLDAAGVPLGVVSNAAGQIAAVHFPGVDRRRIAYVGDSVTMDIGGATAAGLHPILVDPYDDHPDAPFETIRSLADLRG